jgi:hypothetical protein
MSELVEYSKANNVENSSSEYLCSDELIKEFKNLNINKGTGAGGKNTNANGKRFEYITDIQSKLFENKYKKKILGKGKYSYYLYKNINNNKIIYLSQNGLKLYVKKMFNIEIFRKPDEAYIIEKNGKYIMKILEKKNQNVEGSVETKIHACYFLRREYEIIMGKNFSIEYAFCLNKFFKDKINSNKKKYTILKQMLDEYNITIFFGEDDDYFDKIYKWINNF